VPKNEVAHISLLDFMAPEYLRGTSRYTPACDMYAVGMLLYETYSRQDPYAGENVMEVLKKVCDPRIKKRPPVPESMPPKVADVMKKCWSADPTYRYEFRVFLLFILVLQFSISHHKYSVERDIGCRPQAKELDMTLMDMSMEDAEPLTREMINSGGREKPKTVDMLYEVFPRHIADALKAGRKVESETHDMVTVFFSGKSDFVVRFII
jgi:guanylate cyclase, other